MHPIMCAESDLCDVLCAEHVISSSVASAHESYAILDEADFAAPSCDFSTSKNGARGRAPYRFLKRKHASARPISSLAERRVAVDEIDKCFVHGVDILPCCGNFCCARLMGSEDLRKASLTSETGALQRAKFYSAVRETRVAVHGKGQKESGRQLLSRMQLGFSQGTIPLDFAKDYEFPGARSTSKQEYWWRTEEGGCVQVNVLASKDASPRCLKILITQVCREAWMVIHSVSEGRMTSLKKKVKRTDVADRDFERRPQQPRWNSKYESVRVFLENYFSDENGRCEKLPNPRYSREELRLPIWLSKVEVYRIYKHDCEKCGGKNTACTHA